MQYLQKRIKAICAILLLSLVMVGCTWVNGTDFQVTNGSGIYVVINSSNSNIIVFTVFEQHCNYDVLCTQKTLRAYVLKDYEPMWLNAINNGDNLHLAIHNFVHNGDDCMNIKFDFLLNFQHWASQKRGAGCVVIYYNKVVK